MLLALLLLTATASPASAELRPEKVRVADGKKSLSYIKDGIFVGGDRGIDQVTVKDIRRAVNPGFERIVIDLESTQNGEPAAIDRPPYYQLAVNPDERRLVFTVWGRPRLGFDPRKVLAAFQKSAAIQGVVLLPKVEDDSWTFVFELKGGVPVEVFELSNPVRVIMDVKVAAQAAAPKPAPKTRVPRPKAKPKAKPVDTHDALDGVPAIADPEMEEDHG